MHQTHHSAENCTELGVYHDILVLPDEGRNHDFHAIVQNRGLEAVRRGLAFDHRLGLHDLAGDLLRHRRVQRLVLVEFHDDGHSVLKERAAIAQKIRGQLDLLVGLGIHEDKHPVGLIEELLVLLFQTYPLDLVGGAEPLVQL